MRITRKIIYAVIMASMVLMTAVSCDYIRKEIGLEQEESSVPDSIIIHAYSSEIRLGARHDFMADADATCGGRKLKIDVDTSQVDRNTPGDYPVTYTASDSIADGTVRTASKTVRLMVRDPRQRVIYLTFDDGPSANTGRILQILRDSSVTATFFVTAQYPKYFHYITEAYDYGNAIAAHTYSHRFGIYSGMDSYFKDMDKIQSVIKKYTGRTTDIIRFPGGSSNIAFTRCNNDPQFMLKLSREVQDRGYQYVDWNADSRDAAHHSPSAQFIIRNACSYRGSEICLLMHDTDAKNGTVAALPTIIRHYKQMGYEFRTITSTGLVCHHTIHEVKPAPQVKVNTTKQAIKPVMSTVTPQLTKPVASPVTEPVVEHNTKPVPEPETKQEVKSDTTTQR